MILVPSRGRPKQLQRFLDEGKTTLPMTVILDWDDVHNYDEVNYPDNCRVEVMDRIGGVAPIYRRVFNEDYNFYALFSDDLVPETEEWDQMLYYRCMTGVIVWPSDGIGDTGQNPFIRGDLVRVIRDILPPVRHYYSDTFWKELSDHFGLGGLQKDIIVKHHHYTAGLAEKDKTYEERGSSQEDKEIYKSWKKEMWPEVIRRVEYLL